MSRESICIIGGGLGGLFAGALLAKEGCSVTVLEKNHTIGGGLQTFVRDGEVFETGMHIMGGFCPGGSVYKICKYLGILDRLKLLDVDDSCMDVIHYLEDNKDYEIASGREGFVESIAKYFPHERENLKRYVAALYDIANEVDFFYLRTGSDRLFSHSEQFLDSANNLIAAYIDDERLRYLLSYMNPMYGGVGGHTPAYIHALVNVLYINGPSRFVGGSLQLALALKDVIEANGGKVLSSTPVAHIEVVDRMIQWVESTDGTRFMADRYISAIHPCSMIELMSEGALPRSYRNRLSEIPNTYSAFTVYLKLKPGTFPYINHTCYCQDRYDSVWNFGDKDDNNWPHGFMYMTPPVEEQGEWAQKMIITSPMNFELAGKWADTKLMHRGQEYEAWKQEHADRLISLLTQIYPSLPQSIDKMYTSSPLTIRDYYSVKDGSMYGFRKDCQNLALSQVPIFTKVRNLLLTGQNINLHGICGVPLTSVNTAEAILGQNYLVENINKQNKTDDYE